MRARYLPRLWLMTDERLGHELWAALRALPRGSGVVFRHYATPAEGRRRLSADVRRIARARRLVLVRAGAAALRGEDGAHNRRERVRGLKTFAVHDVREAVAARRAGADLVFVSPVFATRSHPGARGLGRVKAVALARVAGVPAVALGGMDARRVRGLRGFWGWAGVDAFRPDSAKPSRQTALSAAGRAWVRDAD